jgi:dimethylhistidine N-methyltransferase
MLDEDRATRGEAAELDDQAPARVDLRDEVLAGLALPQKRIPSKLLYDARGSALFERICELDEYYITRTELGIMETHAKEMARIIGPECMLIEYGSGSGQKTLLLLDHLERPRAYVPIDISRTALAEAAERLARSHPDIHALPVCADYTADYEIPGTDPAPARRVVYFPGSTIGNFDPDDAREFLRHVGDTCGPGGGLLIGVDLPKDRRVLELAYDDPAGVTARFEFNVLTRLNREFDADFDVATFAYQAVYEAREQRVGMYLVSRADQRVRVSEVPIDFETGERLLIEYSYKYDLEGFASLAAAAGFTVARVWTDPRSYFSVQYLSLR